jgi:hypothetical protein
MKLPCWNCSSVVISWNVDDMTVNSAMENTLLEEMERFGHCASISNVYRKSLHILTIDDKEYKILYMGLDTESG